MRRPQPPPWTARRRESDKGGGMLVPDAESLQEWCAVGKDCSCCVETIEYLIFLSGVPRPQATIPMKANSTHFEALTKANRGRRCP